MNKSFRFLIAFFLLMKIFFTPNIFSQQKDFHKLPLPDIASENSHYRLIQIKEQNFLLFTLENYSLIRRGSSDAGYTWSNAVTLVEGTGLDDRVNWFDAHHVGNNKIYLLYKQRNVSGTFLKVSTDLGVSWGTKIEFVGVFEYRNTSFFTTSIGETYFIFDDRYFTRFTSDTSWTIPKIFPGVGTTRNLSLVETTNGLLKVYYSPY
ncbi:MAG: exo-alpha-sialidase [Ignavibacteriaceae bacterium]|nr:exo-alpha-sialidase [Ignavibacteriaceae bacterium]